MIVAGASAYPREMPHGDFAEIARECGAKLFVDMAHYAGLVAAGLHDDPVPVADYVSTTTHKTLRGPRGGMILCKEAYAKDIDRAVFPGTQGGPLMHVIAGKAVCFGEALTPAFKQYARQIIDNAKTLAEVLVRRRRAAGQRRHRQPPPAGRRDPPGPHRPAGRRGPGPLRHHRQQEHDSLRPAQADGPVGHSHRHAGPDHARHGRRRRCGPSAAGSSKCSARRTTRSERARRPRVSSCAAVSRAGD